MTICWGAVNKFPENKEEISSKKPNLKVLKKKAGSDIVVGCKSDTRAREHAIRLLIENFGQMLEIYTLQTPKRKKYLQKLTFKTVSSKKIFLFDKMVVREDFTLTSMSSFCPKIKPSFLVWGAFVLSMLNVPLSGQTVRWGTHKGPASPLHTTFPSANWAANPTSIQKLMDIGGNNLVNSTGGPDSSWTKGDRVELGFFASSFGGDGNPGGGDDTASSNMFEGTWVALTKETYIGQDWGDGTPTNETVGSGEFAFDTDFTQNLGSDPPWEDYAEHNVQGDSAFRIQNGDGDEQTILPALLGDMDTNTKLGIRFYDSTGTNNGTTRYNTVMNNNWTWDPNGITEMYLHDSSNPDNLDTNLRFEFDNSDYGSVSKTGNIDVGDHGDFVTTITYWTGLSGLNISGSNENTVLSGVGSSQNITGGGNNELTLNVNGAGTTSNAYSYSGDIVDTGASGYLELIKTGSGKQTITGNLNMVSGTGSVLHVNDGTLTLATASGKTHSVEYLKGAGGTLELADGASDLITLGFANTNGGDAVGSNSFDYSDATFAGTVLMSGNVAHTVQVGSGTTAGYYEDEQTLSGSLSTSGTDTLVKDGVGRLRLTGDSSSNYDNLITVNHGTLVLGDGSDANADFHSSTSFRVEKGKLEIAANESISNTVQGSATSANNTKSMVGGKGTLSAVTIGSGDNEIDTISPGQGIASSLTSTSSQVQASIGNGAASDSIGTFTVTNLTLNNDAVFDWEITDFDGTAGSDWDVLAYDDLVFGNNAQIDINLFSLLSNGNAGATTGDTFAAKATTSGFKIIDGSGSGSINWGNYGGSGARQVDSLFNINQQGWAHYNHQYGSWGVYYDGGHDFYLTYSAVPEPSTYMMVTGLLMLPGYNFVRRLRKKKLDKLSEEEEGNLS